MKSQAKFIEPGFPLYEFQEKYLQGAPSRYIFAADTGTGKTLMALAHYDRNHYAYPLLILAPAAKVVTGDWEREIDRYFSGRIKPEYAIYSYEKFSRNPTLKQWQGGDIGVWRELQKRWPAGFAIIADEVHRAKNPQSGIGKRVFEMATHQNCRMFVGLSATPMPNGWIDIANYLKIFGKVKNITDFKRKYCIIQDFKGFPEIVGYNYESELAAYWRQMAKPLKKEAALDLPPLTLVPVTLGTPVAYFKLLRERVLGEKFLDTPSALLHALRQSLVGPKIAWLDEFLEGVSDNVVIFYNYKSERDEILQLLKKKHPKRHVFRIDGERHEAPPPDQWPTLHRTITLAQYQAGSTGIELTYASTTVYFSPTFSFQDYEQSIGRIERNGQTRKMTLYCLSAPISVEADVWAALRAKGDFQQTQWIKGMRKELDHAIRPEN